MAKRFCTLDFCNTAYRKNNVRHFSNNVRHYLKNIGYYFCNIWFRINSSKSCFCKNGFVAPKRRVVETVYESFITFAYDLKKQIDMIIRKVRFLQSLLHCLHLRRKELNTTIQRAKSFRFLRGSLCWATKTLLPSATRNFVMPVSIYRFHISPTRNLWKRD